MPTNEHAHQQLLAPPAVTTLKHEHGNERAHMSRMPSMDMRAAREDLKTAAEQSLNVILDLGLDGTIRWVSPSWKLVVGTTPEEVKGKPIADLLLSNQDVFASAVESMKSDDSKSRIIHFRVAVGPSSVLKTEVAESKEQENDDDANHDAQEEEQVLNLKGQGIMVYDRSSGEESHVRRVNLVSDVLCKLTLPQDHVDAATIYPTEGSHN